MRLARAGAVLVAVAAVALTAAPLRAEPAHAQPQKAAHVGFGPGFPGLVDHEWGFALGGFGGIKRGSPLKHTPVIFVHGNTVDAADWYVVRDDFRAAGWTDQELWGLSYNGLGANSGEATNRLQTERFTEHAAMGYDGGTRPTNNSVNVADLYDFIRAVQSYTGSQRFSLVTHSLGVTLARQTMKLHPELRPNVVAFVGIAGGNHGTSLCPPGSEDNVVSCNEIAAGTPWLAALNGTDGADETYGATKWLTVYDGTGVADPAFAGPTYAQSPALRDATNRTYPGTYHNDLRVDANIVSDYRQFIEAAAKTPPSTPVTLGGATPTTRVPSAAVRSLARSGGNGGRALLGAGVAVIALALRRVTRRTRSTLTV